MRRLAFCIFLVTSVSAGTTNAQQITLDTPQNGTGVSNRPDVSGSIDFMPTDENVWVIVHPMPISEYWVQPFATVDSEGNWVTNIHIGRPGSIDIGTDFELRAVAEPREKLSEGQRLSNWPQAKARTSVVIVTRR